MTTLNRRNFVSLACLGLLASFAHADGFPKFTIVNPKVPSPKGVYVYKQSTGELYLDGKLIGKGYSGHGKGLNNPDKESEKNVGPIPRGNYTIGEAFKHDTKGPTVMRLTPNGHTAHGRSGFLIHGDNSQGNKSASEGCIILGPDIRKMIANGKVKTLHVER